MSLAEFYGLLIFGLIVAAAFYWLGVRLGRLDEQERHRAEIDRMLDGRRRR